MPELAHGVLYVVFIHLAVGNGHAGLGNKALDIVAYIEKALDPVVDPEDLPVSVQLPLHNLFQKLVVTLYDSCLHRHALPGRRLNKRQVPDAGHGELQRPGNGRCSQRQHVHIFAHLLHGFLVAHAKALFLVKNEQS